MALHSGQSQRACNTTGMANNLRNRESEKIYESIGFAAALDVITIAAPDMAAHTTCPPGAKKPLKNILFIMKENPPARKQLNE